jgi:hypothetical protein
MSHPVFIHVMSNGDLWFSNNLQDTPVGTVTGTYRVGSDASFQKLGTLSGTFSSSLVAGGANGKQGKPFS